MNHTKAPFLTGIPYGYFGVELSSRRVITTEGLYFHWPWNEIKLVSQDIVTSRRTLKYRSCLGTSVRVQYVVQFRPSPDIENREGRNRFIEWDDDDPPYRRIKEQIEDRLGIDFGWVCRQVSPEDLLRSAEPLELMGQCLLKLRTPPHEDPAFIQKPIQDVDMVEFYSSNREPIVDSYGPERLRPIVALRPGGTHSGRYCGQSIGVDGKIENPHFHAQLSDTEQLLGIEVLDLQVVVDCSPLFMINGRPRLVS